MAAGPEILIPLVAIGGGIFLMSRSMKLKQARLMAGAGDPTGQINAVTGEMSAEIARLKERVAVLEKLVIDDDRKLAEEITRLSARDPQARS